MITLTVNGTSHRLDIDPATPLLYALRGELGLNAAKFGCGLGQCGACTVIVEGEPVFSCLTPVIALQDRRVTTVEGLGTADKPSSRRRSAAIARPA
jgi:nicotinate dehydrogenase subunit A